MAMDQAMQMFRQFSDEGHAIVNRVRFNESWSMKLAHQWNLYFIVDIK